MGALCCNDKPNEPEIDVERKAYEDNIREHASKVVNSETLESQFIEAISNIEYPNLSIKVT